MKAKLKIRSVTVCSSDVLKLSNVNDEFWMSSTGELRVSKNSAASSKRAGSFCLPPYLTLKKHTSKHTQLRNTIKQRHKLNLTLAYLKSAHQELSSEVQLVHNALSLLPPGIV